MTITKDTLRELMLNCWMFWQLFSNVLMWLYLYRHMPILIDLVRVALEVVTSLASQLVPCDFSPLWSGQYIAQKAHALTILRSLQTIQMVYHICLWLLPWYLFPVCTLIVCTFSHLKSAQVTCKAISSLSWNISTFKHIQHMVESIYVERAWAVQR